MRIGVPGAVVVLIASTLAAASPAAEDKPKTPKPLPVDRTRKLIEENAVYTVEGRVRIPRGVELTVLRNVVIKAQGSAPAVIEVEGGFDCIGVRDREVIFENVTVEPCPKFERMHMDMAIFRGTGGVRTPENVAVDGYILFENFDLIGKAQMDVTFQDGSVELSGICAENPTRIRTVIPAGKTRDQVRVFVRGCHQEPKHPCSPHGGRVGLVGGLEVDGGDDVTVQLSRIGGKLCSVRNWGQKLIFDGNKVNAAKLAFSHRDSGQFQKVQCAKLDIYSSEVTVEAPPSPKLKDNFTMDRCWWRGEVNPRVVQEKVIRDGFDDPEKNGTRVVLPKLEDRPHELAGDVDR